MSQIEPLESGPQGPSRDPNRRYIIIAAVLLVVIIIAAILLITVGLPAITGPEEPTAVAEVEPTATPVPTFTPLPTLVVEDTAPPPTDDVPVMQDTEDPVYDLHGAGARPGVEWTGLFGQVLDTDGSPVRGVSVIVWYPDGRPASPVVQTNGDGYYEIRLSDEPVAGAWTIQLLDEMNQPLSKLFTFETDVNTETGIQQIQVLWRKIP